MRTLAHVSDLHFGASVASRVEALQLDLARLQPDLVVVSGDGTQRARTSQFEQWRAFLDELTSPWLSVPGNHDLPLLNPYGRLVRRQNRYRRHIDPQPFAFFSDREIAVAGLDTTKTHGWVGGRLSATRLARIKDWFAGQPESALRVLVSHHCLPPMLRIHSRRQAAVRELLRQCRLDLLLSGHIHSPMLHRGDAHPALHGAVAVRAGTATSHRLREGANTYNIVQISADAMTVTVRALHEGVFQQTVATYFTKSGQGWRPASDVSR